MIDILQYLESSFTYYKILLFICIIYCIVLEFPSIWKKGCVYKTVRDVPGPLALPILGTTWIYSFLFGRYSIAKRHEAYPDLFKRYGPIVKEETIFNYPIIAIEEANDIEKVLKSSGKYPLRPPSAIISHYRKTRPDRYASGGMANEQGEAWHKLRVSLTPELISHRAILSVMPEMKQIAEDLIAFIRLKRTSVNIIENIKPLSEQLGLEASCLAILGRRMGFLLPEIMSLNAQRLYKAVHNHFVACRDTFLSFPFWKFFPTKSYKLMAFSEEEIYDLATELINSAGEETRDSAIFQSILRADIDEREKNSVIVDFIVAGINTLGNSFIFLLYLVGKNPECQEKLLQDLDAGSFEYLNACINEAFRLIPTAPTLARITEKDLDLSGYFIKSGSILICHTGLACRNEKYFKNANEFIPERWLGELKAETLLKATYLYTPFGFGRRICPGKRFVVKSLGCILSEIVRHYRISCPQDLELKFEFIMAPSDPLQIKFEDRL